jgi:NAD(P)-dependent dehydrogenase (short-subunit alcohol dehydrogenase family)
MEFNGKTAVVTGAASGIGRAMVDRFVQAGMRVVLADVEQDALDTAVSELSAGGGDVIGVRTDVSDAKAMDELAQAAFDTYGRVNVVCNNAGVGCGGDIAQLELSDWEWVLGVNLWGVIHGIRVFLPHLLSHGDGHVVNTASMAGLTAHTGGIGPYTASKFAVVGLSEVLYKELAARGSPIGVTLLCPGLVATRIFTAERNRPEPFRRPRNPSLPEIGDPGFTATIDAILAQAKPAVEVGQLVFDAIADRRFYLFTDHNFDPAIHTRLEDIERRRNPTMDVGSTPG